MFTSKKKIFGRSLAMVCGACCLSSEAVMHSRCRDASDARWILVNALSQMLTDTDLSILLMRTRQGICHIRNDRTRAKDTILLRLSKWLMEELRDGLVE